MAQAKYTRIDNNNTNNKRSATSYLSTVTIVVFVALCLFGIWMMTSSSVVPVQNVDMSQDNKNEGQDQSVVKEQNEVKEQSDVIDQSGVKEQSEVTEQATDPSGKSSQQFEENQGDLSADATKGDSTPDKTSDEPEKREEKSDEKSEEKPSDDTKTENQDSNFSERKSDSDESVKQSDSDESVKKSDSDESVKKSDSDENDKKSESDVIESKPESNENKQFDSYSDDKKSDDAGETPDKTEENVEQTGTKDSDEISDKKTDDSTKNQGSTDAFPSVAQSDLLNESTPQNGSFSTQASKSNNEKESQESSKQSTGYDWKRCNVTTGSDFIPCLDNLKAISSLPSTKHYEHRERQCPQKPPTCLVALPNGYKRPIEWPKSREKVDNNTNAC